MRSIKLASFYSVLVNNPIILSCIKDSYAIKWKKKKKKKKKKRSTHICNTENKDILSYDYFSILDLSLQPVISNMQFKVRRSLFSISNFLMNNKLPLSFKKICFSIFYYQ